MAKEAVKPDVSMKNGCMITYVHFALSDFQTLRHFAMGNEQEYDVYECATCLTFPYSDIRLTCVVQYA